MRIARLTGLAASLAAAGLILGASAAAASPAAHATSPTTGPTLATTSSAGYQLSGRDFRFVTATATVPDLGSNVLFPQEYIQLSNGSLNEAGNPTGNQYVRAGIESCTVARFVFGDPTCTNGSWVSYVEAFNNGLSTPHFSHFFNLSGVSAGDGVNFSIYYNEPGNELDFTITPPSTSGTEQFYKTSAHGPVFDHAAALDDFTDNTGQPVPLLPGLNPVKINQFLQAAFTTYSGSRGSFVGPWETSKVLATSNGLLFPQGTVRVNPGKLFTDDLLANGAFRTSDAFTETLVG